MDTNLLRVLCRRVQSHCLSQEQVATCQDLAASEIVCKGTRLQWSNGLGSKTKLPIARHIWVLHEQLCRSESLFSNLTYQYLYCIYYLVIMEWQEGDWGLRKSMRQRGRNETYCWAKVKRAVQAGHWALQTADLLVLPPSHWLCGGEDLFDAGDCETQKWVVQMFPVF